MNNPNVNDIWDKTIGFPSSPTLTCSRSLCSGTGCKESWCWSARRPVWTWHWPRTPEPGWLRCRRHSPADRRPASAAGGTSWTTSARSWRMKAGGRGRREASNTTFMIKLCIFYIITTLQTYQIRRRAAVVPTLLSSLVSLFCVVLILSHVSFHFSDVCPSSASSLCRSCSSFVMASGTVLRALS